MNQVQTGSPSQWLLVADRRRARILGVRNTSHERLHIDQEAQLEEDWDDREHGRPSPRRRDVGYSYASVGHEDDERLRRFVKRVAAWLERELGTRGIQKIHAFAGPRFIGELRWALPPGLEGRFVEHALDLGRLSPGELEEHEAVIALESSDPDEPPARAAHLDRAGVVRSMTRDLALKKEIAYEHAAIRAAIFDLREEIDRLRGEDGPAHQDGSLSGMLPMFRHHLRRHFALEEQGGLLQPRAELGVELNEVIARLLEQHRALERELAHLVEGSRCASQGRACLTDEFVQELRDFLTGLAEHERLENELVHQISSDAAQV